MPKYNPNYSIYQTKEKKIQGIYVYVACSTYMLEKSATSDVQHCTAGPHMNMEAGGGGKHTLYRLSLVDVVVLLLLRLVLFHQCSESAQ